MKRILFLLLFLTQPFVSQSLGQELTYDQVQIFTNNCLKVIQSGNFDDAAELFHYPPNYSPKELDEDKKEVQLWLMELSKLFGTFDKSEIVQRPVSLYKIEIGGGDIPYWGKYPQFIEVKYGTTFSIEGEGFIRFTVVQISKKLELRSVAFSISVDSPDAEKRIEKITSQMMDFVKKVLENRRGKGEKT